MNKYIRKSVGNFSGVGLEVGDVEYSEKHICSRTNAGTAFLASTPNVNRWAMNTRAPIAPAFSRKGAESMINITLSNHSIERSYKWGISPEVIDFIARYYDVERPARRGCLRVSISNRELDNLIASGLDCRMCDKARGIVLILSADGVVVTNYRVSQTHYQSRARRYLKPRVPQFARRQRDGIHDRSPRWRDR